jgi:hypothetical protein
MIRSRVTSNPFRSIAYDEDSRTLEVEYNSGRRYQIRNVGRGLHDKLVNADSVGNFYNLNIRPHFKATEINRRRDTLREGEEAADE